MPRTRNLGDLFTFGGRLPAAVGALTTAIGLASVLGALDRSRTLLEHGALIPLRVWGGEVWRLVTWPFFETEPTSLIFAVLMLAVFGFGRDLCYAWGPRRFLATFVGIAAGAGVVTCLVARFVFPELLYLAWIGPWPVLDAFILGWAMIFPDRQILFAFVMPVSSRVLGWLTVGGTVLFGIFRGPATVVPHLAALALMFAYARGWSLRGLWQTVRIRGYERRARRRASHLKVVKKDPPRWMN